MKTIELVINSAGETRLQTSGFLGSDCQAASRALEQALGLVVSEERIAEFFQSTTLEQHRQAKS